MCYFLYGSINDGINIDEYNKVIKNSKYHFNIGNESDVNKCIKDYRITSNLCDCDTPLGSKKTAKSGIKEFSNLLFNLKPVQGIKYITICKNWSDEPNEVEATIHIDEVDIQHFLANMNENTLYKIELYKKYY